MSAGRPSTESESFVQMTVMIPAPVYRQIMAIKENSGKGAAESFRIFLRTIEMKSERYLKGLIDRDLTIETLETKIQAQKNQRKLV